MARSLPAGRYVSPRMRALLRDLRQRARSRVPDGVARRRPGDAVRVVLALAVLVAAQLPRLPPDVGRAGPRRLASRLSPTTPRPSCSCFYDLLSLWAVALVATALLFLRRWRLARDLALAALVAWVGGRLLAFVVRRTDFAGAFELTFDLTDAPRFPLVRVGVAVAVVTVASPYLARPTRRIGQGLVLALGLAAMYLGRAMPTDVVAAFVLGWGAAAAVHLIVRHAGPPAHGRRRWPRRLPGSGSQFGALRAAEQQPVGRAMFVAERPEGAAAGRRFGTRRGGRAVPAAHVALDRLPGRAADAVPDAPAPDRVRGVRHAPCRRARRTRPARWYGWANSGPLALLVVNEVEGAPLRALGDGADAWAVLDDAWVQAAAIRSRGSRPRAPRRRPPRRLRHAT